MIQFGGRDVDRTLTAKTRLLLATTAVAGGTLLNALDVSTALADNECGVLGAGVYTIDCTGTAYPDGILYSGVDGGLTLNLDNSAMTIGGAGIGVGVVTDGNNTGDIVINAISFDSLTTTGDGYDFSGLQAVNLGTAGNAVVTLTSGDIETSGFEAFGLVSFIDSQGSGNSAVTMKGGSVKTEGEDAYGLHARNEGLGDAIIEISDGSVEATGLDSEGARSEISNENSSASASVTMKGGTVSTESEDASGLYARTDGSGAAVVVVTSGSIETQEFHAEGLYARNSGLGDAAIRISGGTVETAGDDAMGARSYISNENSSASASIVMRGGSVSAEGEDAYGLYARNEGLGDAVIEITGDSRVETTGYGSEGVRSYISNENSSASASVIMNGGTVSTKGEDASGLYARTNGSGAAVIVMTDGTIGTQSGNAEGLYARNSGLGDAAIEVSGGRVETDGDEANAIYARVRNSDSSATARVVISGGTIVAQGEESEGARARTDGVGTAIVEMQRGTISALGLNAHGLSANAVKGKSSIIMTGGEVTGGSGNGAAINTVAGEGSTIVIGSGATVTAGESGIAVSNGDHNRDGIDEIGGSVRITTAGALTGDVLLGGGDDVLNITGGFIDGDIDGQDDVDTLNFVLGGNSFLHKSDYSIDMENVAMKSGTAQLDGQLNADALTVEGGRLILNSAGFAATGTNVTGGTLVVGDRNHFGSILSGGPVRASSGGRIEGIGTIAAATFNDAGGVIVPGDDSIGRLTVGGDYVGNGGRLEVEGELGGDGSAADLLVVTGATSGSTGVRVINRGGLGGRTVDGIRIVDVQGASDGAFTLNGDHMIGGRQAVVAGAYSYMLFKDGVTTPGDGDWYLRSNDETGRVLYSPAAPLYEAYAGTLQNMNRLGTLQERVGNRSWAAAPASVEKGMPSHPGAIDGNGIWAKVEAAHGSFEPGTSTTGTGYDTSLWKLQAGLDMALVEDDAGKLVGGLSVNYGRSTSDIASFHGAGTIETTGYGVGGTLTWYGHDGIYTDGQAQATWYDSDLHSATLGRSLVTGNDGFGYALSIEAGKRIDLSPRWSMTPQAQLSYSSVAFDDFIDPYATAVSFDRSNSMVGRLGISADQQAEWQDAAGRTSRSHVYAIANLYYDFDGRSRTDVAGLRFDSQDDALWGGLGIGASLNLADDKFSLYGEALARTSLENFADSHVIGATVGLRMKW